MRKYFIILVAIFLSIFQFSIHAQDNEISLDKLTDNLPNEINKYVENEFDINTILSDIARTGISSSIKTFSSIIVLCIITVFIRSLSLENTGKSYILRFIGVFICSSTIFTIIYSQIEMIDVYANRLSDLMSGFYLFSNGMFLYCGYVNSAATSSMWIQLIMNFGKLCVNRYMIPLLKILCGIALADTTICQGRLSSFSKTVKNTFLWVNSIIITLITTIMGLQTSMSKVSDVAGVQSIKFAATQAFPIVGGFVSESIRSVAGTANSAKNAGGTIVVALIAIIALLPLSSLLGIKLGLSLSKIGCDMLGCKEVCETIDQAFSLINFMLVCVGILASLFAITAISFMTQTLSVNI